MTAEFTLSEQFWGDLVENYWGKKPGVFKRPSDVPFASARDFFQVLLQKGFQHRSGPPRPTAPPRFYLDGLQSEQPPATFLGLESDGSLDGYVNRVKRQHPGQQFGLVLNEVHLASDKIWANSLEVARGLAQHVGQPVGGTDIVLFLNGCERSAFGFHKDNLENITFVIQGRKRFLLWPYEVLQEIAGTSDGGRWSDATIPVDCSRYRDSAIVLEGDPGDVFYWPTSYWHVAEWSEGSEPVATISFATSLHAFNLNSPVLLAKEVLRLLDVSERAFDVPATYRPYHKPGSDPATHLEEALSDVANHTERILAHPTFRRELEERTLAWLTGFGYRSIPPERPAIDLAATDEIRVDPRYPIIWKHYGPDDVVYSVHGAVANGTECILPLIEALNRGERRTVGSLVAEFACPPDRDIPHALSREDLLEVLRDLYRIRAFHLTRSDHARRGSCLESSRTLTT